LYGPVSLNQATIEKGPETGAPVLLIMANSSVRPLPEHGSVAVRLTIRLRPDAANTGMTNDIRIAVSTRLFSLSCHFKNIIHIPLKVLKPCLPVIVLYISKEFLVCIKRIFRVTRCPSNPGNRT